MEKSMDYYHMNISKQDWMITLNYLGFDTVLCLALEIMSRVERIIIINDLKTDIGPH